MDHDDLRHWSKQAADWAHGYHAGLRDRPVRPDVTPGATAAKLPSMPPDAPEAVADIFADFEAIVPDAITHWQHPRFFAYFPANAAPASMLAEQLCNAIAAQGMLWQTAPAATEIEQVMVDWLRQALGLADNFTGTIHDSATTATLSAVLTMRERALAWQGNSDGLCGLGRVRIYASAQTHSSVLKACRIAGIGDAGLVNVAVREDLGMDPAALQMAIEADKAAGLIPAGVVICTGGTSVGAMDPVAKVIAVAKAHDLWTHVDAAWAGSAMICPEFRYLWDGVDAAHSIVFNPHKWLGAQFDCAVQFLADPAPQVRTLGLRPGYLETLGQSDVTDFNEWTVPLGRRFRALKLWFVLRAYGLDGLRTRIRNHVMWSEELAKKLAAIPGIELTSDQRLSLFSFATKSDASTERLLQRINDDGRIYLTQTRHKGRFVIRVQVGQFDCTAEDVMMVETVVRELMEDR